MEAYRLAAEASRRRPGLGPSNERRQFTSLIDARIEATVDIRMPHILTGVVQMWELRTNPLLIWKVGSITGDKRRILLMSFIEGYTAKAIDTVRVEGSEVQTVPQLPTFFPQTYQDIRFPTRASLNLRIENLRGEVELHRTEAVWLHPPYSVPLAVQDPATGEWQDMTPWLGAYVTPNEPQLMKFLRSAANRHPEGRLTGYQEVVEPQVEAIFSALEEDAQLVYISSIVSSFPDSTVATQRVRLPRESVMERQANALDATLLFASLLEAIGLNPALVLVPGHALLGWEKKEDSDTWDYLETTMIGTHAFDEAVATGRKMVESYQSQFQERGDSPYFHRHALSELRAAGISPLG